MLYEGNAKLIFTYYGPYTYIQYTNLIKIQKKLYQLTYTVDNAGVTYFSQEFQGGNTFNNQCLYSYTYEEGDYQLLNRIYPKRNFPLLKELIKTIEIPVVKFYI